jgi:enamine deaminase RidA (YjgF/YER057c/UK114 family)
VRELTGIGRVPDPVEFTLQIGQCGIVFDCPQRGDPSVIGQERTAARLLIRLSEGYLTCAITGTVGADKSIQDGYESARACALVQLTNLKVALGNLDRVDRILSLNGYVNAVAGFAESPQVINGASDLLLELFGSRGLHARAAIRVSALPKNALVEIQMIAWGNSR